MPKKKIKVEPPPRVYLHARYLVRRDRYTAGQPSYGDVAVQRETALNVMGRDGYAEPVWGRFERALTPAKVNGQPGGMIIVSGNVWRASEFGLYVTADTHHTPYENERCRCWTDQLPEGERAVGPPPVRYPEPVPTRLTLDLDEEVYIPCRCGVSNCDAGRWVNASSPDGMAARMEAATQAARDTFTQATNAW